jgi:plastocyanin
LATTLPGVAARPELRGTATAASRPLSNAVVWLEAPNAPVAPSTGRVVLDQRDLSFYPHVLAVRVGTTVDFPNDDRVFHNVFSFRDGKRFDLGMYPVGTMRRVTFDHAGVSRLFCNIHPNMAAYIVAVDTPYFATTDRSGAFAMPDVPAGSYTFGAWRPGGETLSGTFIAGTGATLDVRWP